MTWPQDVPIACWERWYAEGAGIFPMGEWVPILDYIHNEVCINVYISNYTLDDEMMIGLIFKKISMTTIVLRRCFSSIRTNLNGRQWAGTFAHLTARSTVGWGAETTNKQLVFSWAVWQNACFGSSGFRRSPSTFLIGVLRDRGRVVEGGGFESAECRSQGEGQEGRCRPRDPHLTCSPRFLLFFSTFLLVA